MAYGTSTTYRQSHTAMLDYWFCLAVGIVFAGGGSAVVLSALGAIADRSPAFDHLGVAFGLVLGGLWTALGCGSLWLAREISRTTPRLVITPHGLTHIDGDVTTFTWPEIALIHATPTRLTILPGLRDLHTIPTAPLQATPDAILATIRHYCPSVTITR
ncbi:hypothetical protein ACFVMC_25175 [Nocardia sp. NPDC127579]|uniref:hypothetical protein n=1 Tax=Nocardia sp. NPDC127579 TaxID=3345402 RepID=UPI00362C60FC